jgi:hypothetical protein
MLLGRNPASRFSVLVSWFVLMRVEVLACFDPWWPNLKIAVACFEM